MIIITGALGFIGSGLVRKFNDKGHVKNIIVVDDFYLFKKEKNLQDHSKFIRDYIHRDIFFSWLEKAHMHVEFIFHMGARTDTAEKDPAVFKELNFGFTQSLWQICTKHQIPLVYASSAATYGKGEMGFDDDHNKVHQLKPLNPYGQSKQDFDMWALQQEECPPFWAGLKFFNAYGPNEYHKGRMASVVFHAYKQIRKTGKMKLFRSHRPDVQDGQQKRDFIYIKDLAECCYFFYDKKPSNGLYNIGTGEARSFMDLTLATFSAMGMEPNIEFIDTPEDIRENYQYYTEANINKLRSEGYQTPFYSLEDGVKDYVQNYLIEKKIW